MSKNVAVVGGGAAGFFAAITCKQQCPKASVIILEKSDKVLAKVKVSGGGRCNVTTSVTDISALITNYPRGGKRLRKCFSQFGPSDTVKWFAAGGVRLKTEPDGRMFPVTDSSQTIIDCLMGEVHRLGIIIRKQATVSRIILNENEFELNCGNAGLVRADRVIITAGGSPKTDAYRWLEELGHTIESPVSSLFTFNMPDEDITALMGVVADPVSVRIQGTKLQSGGPLLITHWGMSGPAILKLSAFGARILNGMDYAFRVQVNWLNDLTEEHVRLMVEAHRTAHPEKQVGNGNPTKLPSRLWLFLVAKAGISETSRWSDIQGRPMNRLINVLVNDAYAAKGKTTFKEEFVTCGGVSLEDVNLETMESRVCRGLYFAGEVLDVDGITGGFNFQAAWTTGFIGGRACAASLSE
ncbi:MAG: NAD(P)/FAD-dependent oxidoreductase [Flavobacteriales bacterium]|nr:NAD(P)/FAD-dependent oxidoreductase [Flavobacteriales bacterium]